MHRFGAVLVQGSVAFCAYQGGKKKTAHIVIASME